VLQRQTFDGQRAGLFTLVAAPPMSVMNRGVLSLRYSITSSARREQVGGISEAERPRSFEVDD